jgi:hypothetical protein
MIVQLPVTMRAAVPTCSLVVGFNVCADVDLFVLKDTNHSTHTCLIRRYILPSEIGLVVFVM